MKLVLEVSSHDDAKIAHNVLDAYQDAIKQVENHNQGQAYEITHPVHVPGVTPTLAPTIWTPPVSNAAVMDSAEGWSGQVEIKPFESTPHEEVLARVEAAEAALKIEFTRDQIKRAAEFDPELKALTSKRGRKSAEELTEMQRRTAAVFNANPELPLMADEPVGKTFEGCTAEDLQKALETAEEVAAEPEDQYSHMSKDELLSAADNYAAERFAGDDLAEIQWLKKVWGGKRDDATVYRLRAALRHPDNFLS